MQLILHPFFFVLIQPDLAAAVKPNLFLVCSANGPASGRVTAERRYYNCSWDFNFQFSIEFIPGTALFFR